MGWNLVPDFKALWILGIQIKDAESYQRPTGNTYYESLNCYRHFDDLVGFKKLSLMKFFQSIKTNFCLEAIYNKEKLKINIKFENQL